MLNKTDHEFKIIILGESGVGKTSLAHKYTTGLFNTNHHGVAAKVQLTTKELVLRGRRVKLCIWDTSNYDFFKNVVPNYYDGVLFVYDTADSETFHALSHWLTLFRKKGDEAVALVVGNKIDHPDSPVISRDVGMKFARDEHLEFMESSAKNGHNVINIFEHLTLKILQSKNLVPNEEPLSHVSSPEETYEQLQQPEILNSSNDAHDETLETFQSPEQTTNFDLNSSETVESDDEDLELSFVWVSFLPPIVKLPPDFPPLLVGRRRASTDSVLSVIHESEHNTV